MWSKGDTNVSYWTVSHIAILRFVVCVFNFVLLPSFIPKKVVKIDKNQCHFRVNILHFVSLLFFTFLDILFRHDEYMWHLVVIPSCSFVLNSTAKSAELQAKKERSAQLIWCNVARHIPTDRLLVKYSVFLHVENKIHTKSTFFFLFVFRYDHRSSLLCPKCTKVTAKPLHLETKKYTSKMLNKNKRK